MTNAIERMKRVRLLSEAVSKVKINRKRFVAMFALDYGFSSRTVNDYLQCLIDAGEVECENKEIWK